MFVFAAACLTSGGVDDPQSFNTSELRITGWIQYTRPDGVTPKFTADMELWGTSNMVQFGGEKPTYDSPPHMHCECYI